MDAPFAPARGKILEGDEFGWLSEDNYFDLVPGVEKRIQIMGMHSKGKIRIKPYYDEKYTEIDF